jgi:hypothetical protein
VKWGVLERVLLFCIRHEKANHAHCLSGEAVFEQKSERKEKVSHVETRGKRILSRKNEKYKVPVN